MSPCMGTYQQTVPAEGPKETAIQFHVSSWHTAIAQQFILQKDGNDDPRRQSLQDCQAQPSTTHHPPQVQDSVTAGVSNDVDGHGIMDTQGDRSLVRKRPDDLDGSKRSRPSFPSPQAWPLPRSSHVPPPASSVTQLLSLDTDLIPLKKFHAKNSRCSSRSDSSEAHDYDPRHSPQRRVKQDRFFTPPPPPVRSGGSKVSASAVHRLVVEGRVDDNLPTPLQPESYGVLSFQHVYCNGVSSSFAFHTSVQFFTITGYTIESHDLARAHVGTTTNLSAVATQPHIPGVHSDGRDKTHHGRTSCTA